MMEQPESDSEDKTEGQRPLKTQIVNLIFLIQHLIGSHSQSQDKPVQDYLNNLNNQLETFLRNFYPQEDFFGEMSDRAMWNRLTENGGLNYYAEYEKKLTGLSRRMLTAKQQFYAMCDTIRYEPDTGYGSWAQLKQGWEQFRTHTLTDRTGARHKVLPSEEDWSRDLFRKYQWEYVREKAKQLQERFDDYVEETAKQIRPKLSRQFRKISDEDLKASISEKLKSTFPNAFQVYVYREMNPYRLELQRIFNTDFVGTFDELKTKMQTKLGTIPDDDLHGILSEMMTNNEIDKTTRVNPAGGKREKVYHKHKSNKNTPSRLNPNE